MGKLKIALAQMEVGLGRTEENFQRARRFISEARERGAELVLLPELWASG